VVLLVGLAGCGPTLGEVQQREKPFVEALKPRLQAALDAVATAPDAPATPSCPQVDLRYDSAEPSSKFFKGRNVELWSDLVLQHELTGTALPTQEWFGGKLG
jgi:hypothetical protein